MELMSAECPGINPEKALSTTEGGERANVPREA